MARTPHDNFPDLALPAAFDEGRGKGEQLRELLEAIVAALPPGSLLPGAVEWGRSRYRGGRYDIVFDVHP